MGSTARASALCSPSAVVPSGPSTTSIVAKCPRRMLEETSSRFAPCSKRLPASAATIPGRSAPIAITAKCGTPRILPQRERGPEGPLSLIPRPDAGPVFPALPHDLDGSDVGARALRPVHATLVPGRSAGRVGPVDQRASGLRDLDRHPVGVHERAEPRVLEEVPAAGEAAALRTVVVPGRVEDPAGGRLARRPAARPDHRVLPRDRVVVVVHGPATASACRRGAVVVAP